MNSRLAVSFSLDGVLHLVVAGAVVVGIQCATRAFNDYIMAKKEMYICDKTRAVKKVSIATDCVCGKCTCNKEVQEKISGMGFSVVDDFSD